VGIFKKGLPMSICPLDNNPEGNKHQGRLMDIDKQFIIINTGEPVNLRTEAEVRIDFHIERSIFSFESSVQSVEGADKILLVKPKVIHKKQIRDTDRMETAIKIFYTLWTETGRFEAETRDISEQGIRIVGAKKLRRGSLLSLNFYIKEPKIRVICQGSVAWCKTDEENEYLFESGIQFTTLSNEIRKKLNKYVKKVLEVYQAEKSEWDEGAYGKFGE